MGLDAQLRGKTASVWPRQLLLEIAHVRTDLFSFVGRACLLRECGGKIGVRLRAHQETFGFVFIAIFDGGFCRRDLLTSER